MGHSCFLSLFYERTVHIREVRRFEPSRAHLYIKEGPTLRWGLLLSERTGKTVRFVVHHRTMPTH